jgi:hypothetical protein
VKFFIFSLILMSTFAVNATDEFNVYVNTFDQDMDTSSLNEKEIKKEVGPGKLKDQSRELPSPATMNGIFLEAGLSEEVKSMDRIEKDLFFLKVWKKPLSFVLPRYPTIKESKIIKLKKVIEERLK